MVEKKSFFQHAPRVFGFPFAAFPPLFLLFLFLGRSFLARNLPRAHVTLTRRHRKLDFYSVSDCSFAERREDSALSVLLLDRRNYSGEEEEEEGRKGSFLLSFFPK